MNAFSKMNMREVTRLTRAGRLAEAMALLQGRAGAADEAPAPAQSGAAPDEALGLPGLAKTMQALRGRLPTLANFSRPGETKPAVAAPRGARFEERLFSNDAGSRSYKIYVPSGYVAGEPTPLVVMLHGCTQNPDDFAAGTGMNAVAEERKFLVAYPHQPKSANMNKCWNWFSASDQQRGRGEPSLIAGIAMQAAKEFSVDRRRIYVAGLSAGGAAAAILAATYPDVFAAAGVHSGLACGAARDMQSAFAAMGGKAPPPPVGDRPRVPTIVFHGDADRTVSPVNGEQIAEQIRQSGALTSVVTRGETPAGVRFTRTVQRDAAGAAALEYWVLHGAGHAWSGGSPNGSYTDPRGPDASREMARFFLAHALP